MKAKTKYILARMYLKGTRLSARKRNHKSLNPIEIIKRERIESKLNQLFLKSYKVIGKLKVTAYVTEEPMQFSDREKGVKVQLKEGDIWAKNIFDCAWMNVTGEVNIENTKNLVFLIDTGGEGLIYTKEGIIKQGITCFASSFSIELGEPHKKVVISEDLIVDGKVDFWIDAGANDLFGNLQENGEIKDLSIAIINSEIRGLYYDLFALMSAYDYCKDTEFNRNIFKKALCVSKSIDDITEEKAHIVRQELLPFLNTPNDEGQFDFSAIGHAHLDLAWLWPIRESKRKGARTFANQILNISKYPNYIFGASQAQLYQWIKDEYPQLYIKVKMLQTTPNWDVQGATWVEMDSNLISLESLIRQFYYGKKFFQEEFGQDMKILWLPDSFGYSSCIPQIMKLAEVPYFLTQKMSWNRVNKFPYHTFFWEGLDGTKVFAHMLPDSTYNSPLRADRFTFGVRNYQEKAISNSAITLYGIGDGGGGPGFEHIEKAYRFQDLNGLPKIKMSKAIDGFSRLDDGKTNYPVHSGELYLEKHQGTYTTQSKNKFFNRRLEFLLKNYEQLMPKAISAGVALPIELKELELIWKEVLLYQFHDILPGSSINRVYDESVCRYQILLSKLEKAIDHLLSKTAIGKLLYNPNPFFITTIIKQDEKWLSCKVDALGYLTVNSGIPIKEKSCIAKSLQVDKNNFITKCILENTKLKMIIDKGIIISLINKTSDEEYVNKGGFGVLSVYKDKGDCWDIRPIAYQKTKRNTRFIKINIEDNLSGCFAEIEWVIDKTTITEKISILTDEDFVNLELAVNWQQKSSMLRMAFDTTIKSQVCAFNVQNGHIFRKTTEDDSVEKEQYEVSAQKFVDLSNNNLGFSLINDCKYGYRVKHSVVDINLIRSPKNGPGRDVDQGENSIKLMLYPHKGNLGYRTYQLSYQLNNPIIQVLGREKLLDIAYKYTIDNPNIILETIKVSEDGTGIVARFYNSKETTEKANYSIEGYLPIAIVNILEKPITSGSLLLTLGRFQVVSVMLKHGEN